ncbi:hypothetical protein [Mycobacterium sp. AZCC_0083]|uniref:hypothetical protein n=1 Tax=Mycobacterium sp. AZCC_0083 TaxID=2735882 RepID=UPI0016100A94|nr:hypothetical protein [Mycobacterium sp. AZCC_0083]MBB5167089.1 hypothetical protein [Mycobacterium sp. AZCC_0083]
MSTTKVVRVWVNGLRYELCEGCPTWHPRAVHYEGEDAVYHAMLDLMCLGMVRMADPYCHASSPAGRYDTRRETWRETFHHPETGAQADLFWERTVASSQPFAAQRV